MDLSKYQNTITITCLVIIVILVIMHLVNRDPKLKEQLANTKKSVEIINSGQVFFTPNIATTTNDSPVRETTINVTYDIPILSTTPPIILLSLVGANGGSNKDINHYELTSLPATDPTKGFIIRLRSSDNTYDKLIVNWISIGVLM